MKENRGMNIKIVDLKEYSSKEVGLLVQVVLIELLLIFAIINLITDVFMPAFYAILAMIMFVMAYNNKKCEEQAPHKHPLWPCCIRIMTCTKRQVGRRSQP